VKNEFLFLRIQKVLNDDDIISFFFISSTLGILGLDLLPILIGTLPVVALIIPTVLCGSFGYMGSLDSDDGEDLYPWAGKRFL
jgi:hypothetical protein